MSNRTKKAFRKQLIKLGYGKRARALFWEFINRQFKGASWDNRECYGVGFDVAQEMSRIGFDYLRAAK